MKIDRIEEAGDLDWMVAAVGVVDQAARMKDMVQGEDDREVTVGGRLDIAVNEAANAVRRVRDLVAEMTLEDM